MTTTAEAAHRFLASKRIAVTGVSRTPKGHGSNVVYERLRTRGYDVVAVNPNAEQVEGDSCYPDLRSIPGSVEAVVIATAPEHAEGTVRECVDLGIQQVWMHGSFAGTSVSPKATEFGRQHGLTVIDGGCPLMYGKASDGGHRLMCRVLTWTGKVPRQV